MAQRTSQPKVEASPPPILTGWVLEGSRVIKVTYIRLEKNWYRIVTPRCLRGSRYSSIFTTEIKARQYIISQVAKEVAFLESCVAPKKQILATHEARLKKLKDQRRLGKTT